MRNKFLGTGDPGYNFKRKLLIIFSGLRYAILYDFSVAYKMALSVVVFALALVFNKYVDVLLIVIATAMVLITEIFNSAVEALCDFVEEGHNEKIRVIKDIAAAAVGISIFVWILVLGFEVLQMWRLRGVM
jgi:diacylglycerol kinase (ATP)